MVNVTLCFILKVSLLEQARNPRSTSRRTAHSRCDRLSACEAISNARAYGQPDCDELGIRADERRLHLPEQMHVAAAHRQHIVAPLEVNLRSFIVMSRHMADRAQIHDHRSMDLRE